MMSKGVPIVSDYIWVISSSLTNSIPNVTTNSSHYTKSRWSFSSNITSHSCYTNRYITKTISPSYSTNRLISSMNESLIQILIMNKYILPMTNRTSARSFTTLMKNV